MGDSGTTGTFNRRRRATMAAGKSASLLPMDGKSGAACQNSVTADISADSRHGKRDRSLDTARSTGKSEKKKRRNDLSDRMRWVTTRMREEKVCLGIKYLQASQRHQLLLRFSWSFTSPLSRFLPFPSSGYRFIWLKRDLTLKQTRVNGRSLSQKCYTRFCRRLVISTLFLTL